MGGVFEFYFQKGTGSFDLKELIPITLQIIYDFVKVSTKITVGIKNKLGFVFKQLEQWLF